MTRTSRLTACALALAAGACGGGGGGSGPSLAVTFDPPTLETSFRSDRQATDGTELHVKLTFDGELPDVDSVRVVQGGAVLNPQDPMHAFAGIEPSTYDVWLNLNRGLAPGTYSGTMAFQLCRNEQCTSTYPVSGASIDYEVIVVPGFSVAAYVNGVARTLSANWPGLRSLRVASGDTVRIEVSEAVTFTENDSDATASSVVTTESTWQGAVWLDSRPSSPVVYGSYSVYPRSVAGPGAGLEVHIGVE